MTVSIFALEGELKKKTLLLHFFFVGYIFIESGIYSNKILKQKRNALFNGSVSFDLDTAQNKTRKFAECQKKVWFYLHVLKDYRTLVLK